MILVAFALACSTPPPAPAPPPVPVAAPSPPPPAPVVAPPTPPVAPEYVAGVAALKAKQAELAALLDAGKYKDIHPVAKEFMDLAVALPPKAATLPADVRTDVTLKAVDAKKQADALHDAADKADADGAKAAFAALTADVDALDAHAK